MLFFGVTAFAAEKVNEKIEAKYGDRLKTMVPDFQVLEKDGNEFDLLTKNKTVVEVEFANDLSVDEASGKAATAGDVFTPGGGLISLEEAVASLKKAGKSAKGEWSLEKSFTKGWIYEFEGEENGKRMEYSINAKNGSLVSSSRDIF